MRVCAQLCPALCDAMDCSLPSSSVHGIFQARKLQSVAISFFRGSSQPRAWIRISCISCIGRWILYHWATGEANMLMRILIFFKFIFWLCSILVFWPGIEPVTPALETWILNQWLFWRASSLKNLIASSPKKKKERNIVQSQATILGYFADTGGEAIRLVCWCREVQSLGILH